MGNESIIIRCPGCGVKNRIPASRTGDRPVCGKCKATIPVDFAPGAPVEITDYTFEEEVMSCPGPVLVDCWAPWCGPCRSLGPVLEQLAAEYRGRLKIAKLNSDDNPKISMKYNIRSIPTMLLFNNGKLVDTLVGALPKQEIEKRLSSVV
ncbi:MAG: thioredoxin TrxC [Deltaproteobacteria bacterium]|nr:thioredoxin TrxC [Deltaproteobacteria bacterium]